VTVPNYTVPNVVGQLSRNSQSPKVQFYFALIPQILTQFAASPLPFSMLSSNRVVVVHMRGCNLHLGQDALLCVGIELPEP
jgi:hypothetical protein